MVYRTKEEVGVHQEEKKIIITFTRTDRRSIATTYATQLSTRNEADGGPQHNINKSLNDIHAYA